MKYKVTSFTVTCDESLRQTAHDLLADALSTIGYEAFEDTSTDLEAYIPASLYDAAAVNSLLQTALLPATRCSYTTRDMPDIDWNETWEQSGFDPIDVEGALVVCDANHPERCPEPLKGQTPVYIAARQAFGTGTHETTRMILSTLLHLAPAGRNVLDCGCGTGILGIAASLLGARDVTAYDIDEWSVDNTRHNATLNGVSNLHVFHGDSHVLDGMTQRFDIVMANINRNILLADMPAFARVLSPKGTLILSGFYVQDADILLERASALGLTETSRYSDGDWCCLQVSRMAR